MEEQDRTNVDPTPLFRAPPPRPEIRSEEGLISLGPWGGKAGVDWAYKAEGPIMQITLRYGQVVHSISFQSKSDDGKNIGSPVKFGGTGAHEDAVFQKFYIDSSVEQLSCISMTYEEYFGEVLIVSLGFNTNLFKYGPFGSRSGASSVSIPIEGGVIAGFHGRNVAHHLTAIGIIMAPEVKSFPSLEQIQPKDKITHEEGWISLGPWGGDDGEDWAYKLDGPIMQISIRYGDVIHSILFESKSCDGVVIGSSVKHGGTGGDVTETFCIDSSVEQLSSISLTWKRYNGKTTVTSLCFYTNLKRHGPYGLRAVASVSIPIQGGVIAGFHGRGGTHLTAIGIFVALKVNSFPSLEKKVASSHLIDEDTDSVPTQLKGRISAEEGWISLGPWGGEGGGEWAYRPDGPIMQITIGYGRDGPIHSILFESKTRDDVVIGSSMKFGGDFGGVTETFCIDSSVEQLSSISVTYGVPNYTVLVIVSLSINTNLKKNGPFGLGSGAYSVSIPIEGGVIAGFHGRAGIYLDSIGIFVAPKINSLPSSEKNDDILYSIQDPNFARTQPKELIVQAKQMSRKGKEKVSYPMSNENAQVQPLQDKNIGIVIRDERDQNVIHTHEGKKSEEDGWISLGPLGGKDGVDWVYKPDGPIMQISICYGEAINSILFKSRSCDGFVVGSSKKIGSTSGRTTETFCIDSSVEQLSSISLEYGDYDGQVTIISLCFNTNLKKYGPFGLRLGASSVSIPISSVSIPIEGGVLLGFHGRLGNDITAIGIFVAPKVNSAHLIQDPDSAPNQLKVSGSGVGALSSSANTNTDNPDGVFLPLPPSASKMIRDDLLLVQSALMEYMDHMNVEIKLATEKFQELIRIRGSEREFDEIGKAIAKLRFQIPLIYSEDDHHGGAVSPTSKMIRSDLILVDTAFAEAKESMYHMNVKINQAHDKFNDLQLLPSSEGDSDKLRKADSDKLRKDIAKLKVRIRSYHKIRSVNSNLHHKNWDNINGAEDGMTHFFHKEPEVTQTGDFDGILKAFHDLPKPLQDCLLCFFKFPPMATIKRTPMIYLWIGQGYISDYLHFERYVGDVEEHADKIFDDFITKGFIEPINPNCCLMPDSCKMSLVRSSLYEEAKHRGFISNGTSLDLDPESGDLIRHSSCLINVGEAIVNFQPEILENMKHIRSLYLGKWQISAAHHIELADAKILHGLNKLNSLTFLSLRGVSMITELPTCILELNDLMILDLRACHNLLVIPNEIGVLKSLTHLDMSECYFLEHMPKSLAQLSNLEVLKGFLIGDFNDNEQSCTLRDLSGLRKLRKLNIYICVKDLLILQDLEYLEKFESLKKLTISWARVQARAEDITKAFHFATLPPGLQKLDLQYFPMMSLTNWLIPGKLKELKKLYIRGGQLCDLGEIQKPEAERLNVEILQLKYLSKFELHWKELRTLFPKLICLHQVECPSFFHFECDERGIWKDHKAIDTISSSSMLGSGSTST